MSQDIITIEGPHKHCPVCGEGIPSKTRLYVDWDEHSIYPEPVMDNLTGHMKMHQKEES